MKEELIAQLGETGVGRSLLYAHKIVGDPKIHEKGLGHVIVKQDQAEYPWAVRTVGTDENVCKKEYPLSLTLKGMLTSPFFARMQVVKNDMTFQQVAVSGKSVEGSEALIEARIGTWNGKIDSNPREITHDASWPIHLRLLHGMIDILTENGLPPEPSIVVVTYAGVMDNLELTQFKSNHVLAAQVVPGENQIEKIDEEGTNLAWEEAILALNARYIGDGVRTYSGRAARAEVLLPYAASYMAAVYAGHINNSGNLEIARTAASNLKLVSRAV